MPSQIIVAACAVLIVLAPPGLVVTDLLWRNGKSAPLGGWERMAIGVGVGLALPPLILLGCELLGVRWSRGATITYALVAFALLLWRARGRFRTSRTGAPSAMSVALGVALCVAIAVRLYVIRDLPVGLFGDSLHHTLITQLIVDHGGLFASWEPYAPLTTMTYHFGFHATAAFAHWLGFAEAPQSVMVTGQMLNALAMCGAFALAARLARTSGAPSDTCAAIGLISAALTGFVNPQPVYFVNWGRFTQLAGQVILPALLLIWAQLIENSRSAVPLRGQLPHILLAGSVTAGLICTHYIVTIWAALLVGVYLIASVMAGQSLRQAARMLAPASISASIAVVLALPWLFNTMGGYLTRNTNSFVSGAESAARVAGISALGPIVPEYLNRWVLLAALGGLLIALAQRHWRPALLAVWSTLIVLSITPRTLGLPGTGVINWLTGYIALYVTVTPLAGYGIAYAIQWLGGRLSFHSAAWHSLRRAVVPVLALALAVFGANWQRNIVNTGAFQLVAPADVAAMAWIRDNTQPNARFLVNAFPAYDGTMLAGNDAGWWLPYLSGRASTLPPITYGSERGVGDRPEIFQRSIEVWMKLRQRPMSDAAPVSVDLATPAARAILNAAGITHVYIGAVSTPPRALSDHIDEARLRSDAGFQLVYERDGVSIFALR